MLSDSVMICQWAKLFTQLMRSRMTICSGVSNGSAALATIRAFPASPRSMFVWRSSPKARRTRSAHERVPLKSRRERSKIGVGLLPYVWIGSVWQKRRPVITNLSAYRGRVSIDATSLRMVALGMATSRDNAIPRSSYLFGASWPNVCRTLLVAVEQDGDPYAVMVPTAEIIRFYYDPSTRLAQALFWGEYHNMFNADRSGVFKEGVVRVHLRRWLEDEDSWTLARYICSPLMQSEVSELYRNLQVYQINSPNLISQPDQALRCGFPFAGPTTIQGICLRLPGPTPDGPPRWLVLRIERCSAPFPFDLVIVDRDNSSARGPNVEDENLIAAWAKTKKPESELEEQTPEVFCSSRHRRCSARTRNRGAAWSRCESI